MASPQGLYDIEDAMDIGRGEDAVGGSGGVLHRARKRREKPKGYDIPGAQTVYLRTYGCSHNTSDSEYMAGQLVTAGYGITEQFDEADCYLINSCTVKNPSEEHFLNEMRKALKTGKPTIVSGCVPSGDPHNPEWKEVSVIGVQQIHRVVEVVQEALRGHRVELASKGKRAGLPSLALPKVRRNRWVEIVPINAGCLNKCTYCKTKHARGDLQSYPIEDIVQRVQEAVVSGVKEIRLTSEDSGAYGIDIGTSIVELLRAVVEEIPDGVMLRLGMTNPPYILDHLDDIAEILKHPRVYEFLHVPVQAGSNDVLNVMQREYTVEQFRHVCDVLLAKVPNITLATDIICGFPSETEEQFEETLDLCRHYQFPSLYISQFYPRSGTPAAAMKQLTTQVKKDRSRRLTALFESYQSKTEKMVGEVHRVWITEVAHDGHHLVGHTKGYVQVLVSPDEADIGTSVTCEIVEATKHSVKGKVVPLVNQPTRSELRNRRPASPPASVVASSPSPPLKRSHHAFAWPLPLFFLLAALLAPLVLYLPAAW